jgi:hypothetical protein
MKTVLWSFLTENLNQPDKLTRKGGGVKLAPKDHGQVIIGDGESKQGANVPELQSFKHPRTLQTLPPHPLLQKHWSRVHVP